MKRLLLSTALILASVTFGCQGMGPGAIPGSGSSFQGGTEAGNPPTDGNVLGGTEAGNPPVGDHGTGDGGHDDGHTMSGDQYCNVNGKIVHCGTCVDGKTADGKEDCTPLEFNDSHLDMNPENIGLLKNHDGEEGDATKQSISINPDAARAIEQHVIDLGQSSPVDNQDMKIKMPVNDSILLKKVLPDPQPLEK